MTGQNEEKPRTHWRQRLHEIIFESDTPAGKTFDVILIASIILSILLVMLESVVAIRLQYGDMLYLGEWIMTLLFTVEIVLRLIAVRRPLKYLFSFFGMIDVLSVMPTYASLFLPGAQALLVVRAFRLLRVFRVFKLPQYLGEAQVLVSALKSSRAKITVFLVAVVATVVTTGALMYLVEGDESGFTSIPASVYWAIVTMTTVGYGDIAPQTPFGQFLASCLMVMGYGVLAVPTGIVTTELIRRPTAVSGQACPNCSVSGHDTDAKFCKICAAKL